MKAPIYLDYNATTPCHPEVLEEMLPFFTKHFGNAASKHHPYGWIAEEAVELARARVAQAIGAKPKEIIFTSGATEAINQAIKGTYFNFEGERQHYITCLTEHKAVLDTFQTLESWGAEVTYLPVNGKGEIDLSILQASLRPHTKMIALMWANNETGLIHPMDEIFAIAERHGVILFTDAVQGVGKIPVTTSHCHLMALSAHKFYGPKGVGALFIRHNDTFAKPKQILDGGNHEKGFRSGTLNVPGIVGMGKAAEIARKSIGSNSTQMEELRNSLENAICQLPGISINGSVSHRLPHVSNLAFEGVQGEDLLFQLNKTIACSSGSACSSITPKASHVLKAMGLSDEQGKASIRFSLGWSTTKEDIEIAIQAVRECVEKLRVSSGQ
ncbi:cysteine desulfurase family protein [Mongoliitalea daihaiensis]|uniref:cysteine desulfurase family protein n=1 Tax=Mongoliitalea daihaiensis TaxID=2782006 RepID=UPI001F250499|nr:cysteine desulfurase family protein [Mongoliitalea daihaiensis]UJP64150.1 cysteine desulfurase [Mongoliitalea daihaiensis]